MIIRDILNMKGSAIVSIGPEGTVAQAVGLMVGNDIGSLVVMAGGSMVGMLTFREVLHELDARGGDLGGVKVAAVMVKDPIVGHPSESVDHLREVMTTNHVRYLPVKEGDKLLGVISFHDVAKAAINMASFENRLLKRYIKNWPEDDEPA
ncbi:MAG TPA: CBS domain-containing protein, partial [Burkholderiales bacterium]|nr:CBS domain-containing protein [Burkholderiales bacterium]